MHTSEPFQRPPLALVTRLTMWTKVWRWCQSRTAADRLVFPRRLSSHCSVSCKYLITWPLHDFYVFYFYWRGKHVSPRPCKGGLSYWLCFHCFPSQFLGMAWNVRWRRTGKHRTETRTGKITSDDTKAITKTQIRRHNKTQLAWQGLTTPEKDNGKDTKRDNMRVKAKLCRKGGLDSKPITISLRRMNGAGEG